MTNDEHCTLKYAHKSCIPTYVFLEALSADTVADGALRVFSLGAVVNELWCPCSENELTMSGLRKFFGSGAGAASSVTVGIEHSYVASSSGYLFLPTVEHESHEGDVQRGKPGAIYCSPWSASAVWLPTLCAVLFPFVPVCVCVCVCVCACVCVCIYYIGRSA